MTHILQVHKSISHKHQKDPKVLPLSSAMNCVKERTSVCACAVKSVNLEAKAAVQAISRETKSYGASVAIGSSVFRKAKN